MQTKGVLLEGKKEYNGCKAWLVYRGGQCAATKARSRVGQKGYNVFSNNCEHFASEVCGLGKKSNQVRIASGKLAIVLGTELARALGYRGSFPKVTMTGGLTTGGYTISQRVMTFRF